MKPKHLLLFCCILGLLKTNAQRPFITIWNTGNPGITANNQIFFRATGTNYNISWMNINDASDTGSTIANGADTITFSAEGIYKLYITPGTGIFTAIKAGSITQAIDGDCKKLLSIEQWGDINWSTFDSAFYNCANMVMNATDVPSLSHVADMSYAFGNCASFTTNAAMNNWDVSKVTNMKGLFYLCSAFNQLIENWDVGNVTTMSDMFFSASAYNQPLNSWNVSNVTNMYEMFGGDTIFNQPLNNWNVSSVNNMRAMFVLATSFNQPLGNWNVSNVFYMYDMFGGATAFNQPIGNWNVGNVIDMSYMFSYAISFNQPLENWDVHNVRSMSGMFYSAHAFNQSLSKWNLNGIPNMLQMLDSCGMNCSNYSYTLKGWANSASTPNDLQLGAFLLTYDSAFAKASHDSLTNIKGWTIDGDKTGNCSLILPVSFLSFSVNKQDSKALINWSVANEKNTKGYYIEKSTNGLSFNSIAFIAGKGASKQTTYTFTDNNLINGQIYYRIKEVDNDGKYMYSSVQKIESLNFTWKIHGNPVNNSFIELMLDKPANISITISSSNGNIIRTIKKGNLSTGNYNIPLDINNVGVGLYIVKLMVNDKAYTSAVIKQ